MVLMAQPFAYRYPIVDGQGNWGSQDDPKSFAAMRYTEAKLTRYAEVLLAELAHGTVDWQPNFDGTLEEPVMLPARLPNLLLNGTTGIAVGMATDIPPHNLREVASACIHLLEDPEATTRAADEARQGPGPADRRRDHLAARGPAWSSTRRASAASRRAPPTRSRTATSSSPRFPYQVSRRSVQEQIAEQMRAKKLPMVEDIRDESDHENPTRLVIVPRSNRVDMVEVMNHLFATTDLERSYRVNLNIIGLDGRPQRHGPEGHADGVARVPHRDRHAPPAAPARARSTRRLHILEGLLVAYLNLDEVIRIIRREDEPKPVLMKRFKLSEEQAEEILETKLRHLAKLEEMKIREEQKELAEEREELEALLKSKAKLKKLVAERDPRGCGEVRRRAPHEDRRARGRAGDRRDRADSPTSRSRSCCRRAASCARPRATRSIRARCPTRRGDAFQRAARGRSLQPAVFLDSTGRTYTLAGALAAVCARQRRAAVGPAQSAGWREVRRRDDGRAGGSVAARERCGLRIHRALEGADHRPARRQDGAQCSGERAGAAAGARAVAGLAGRGREQRRQDAGVPGRATCRRCRAARATSCTTFRRKKAAAREELMAASRSCRRTARWCSGRASSTRTLEWDELKEYRGQRAQRGAVLPRGWPRKVERLEASCLPAPEKRGLGPDWPAARRLANGASAPCARPARPARAR